MKLKATNGNLFTEPKKDLEGSTTSPPTKVPIRRGIGVAERLARPVLGQVEVEVPDDDSPNHLRRHCRARRAEAHVPIGRCEKGVPG